MTTIVGHNQPQPKMKIYIHAHKMDLHIKVQFFWEGHKNVRNRPYEFKIYLVKVKTMRMIAQIFVAFS